MTRAVSRVVAVATSGGRDSTALLHVTARMAAAQGLQVAALHVHHGLVSQADDWVRHLRRQTQRWARAGLPVSLHVTRLEGQPAPGDSVEAWARRGRYDALTQMAHMAGASLLLLAHHEADQAETFLLQALRIGSPAGLSAMPAVVERAGLTWARPWLNVQRAAINAYVQRHRLAFVDDSSNAETRFARNRLRLQVLPMLEDAFPGALRQLAAAAQRQQEAAACLRELAETDLRVCVDTDGHLKLAAWQLLSAPRRQHLLRSWLQAAWPAGIPESLVHRLCDELPASRSGARWPLPGGWVIRQRGVLCLRQG
ncbi:MAG: tRNA lysidine(34) synthetase TilS [Rubrivivax sp.]|nr:tRNA lysidine(34) synthetase TilS [Rubrivivax sp.]